MSEVLTPRLKNGTRIHLVVSAEDAAKVQRGRFWEAVVTDLSTGKLYQLLGASCGQRGCLCDAVATPIQRANGR